MQITACRNPTTRWGGLMRNIDQTDFETANIEFIEFWMQDPYVPFNGRDQRNSNGGKLYFNLGNISEDILKDGKRFYENGLPTPAQNLPVDTTIWGKVPLNPIQVTNAFSNEPADRPYQDVGFDGNNDDSERVKSAPYLNSLAGIIKPCCFSSRYKMILHRITMYGTGMLLLREMMVLCKGIKVSTAHRVTQLSAMVVPPFLLQLLYILMQKI